MSRPRGFNKFEFSVIVAVFGILAAALAVRLIALQAEAERTEVDLTVQNIRTGIEQAVAEYVMRGEEQRIIEISQASPIDFLQIPPDGTAAASVANSSAQWAFDPVRRELIYRPRSPEAFAGATELRWRYIARTDSSGRTIGAGLIRLN